MKPTTAALSLLIAGFFSATVAAAAGEGKVVWEYAILGTANQVCTWMSPEGTKAGKDCDELARQMGYDKSREQKAGYLEILNLAGKDGWELVQITSERVTFYYLKRSKE